jgi:hypothetical protein
LTSKRVVIGIQVTAHIRIMMSEPLSCWASSRRRAGFALTLVGDFVAGLTLVALVNTLVIFAYLAGAASVHTLSFFITFLARATSRDTGSVFAIFARATIINALAISTSLTLSTQVNAHAIFALLAGTASNALAVFTGLALLTF